VKNEASFLNMTTPPPKIIDDENKKIRLHDLTRISWPRSS